MDSMEQLSEREEEQLRRLSALRKQLQILLKHHLLLPCIAFVLFLCGLLALLCVRVTLSPTRYVARISLHYYPKQSGKIRPYEEQFMSQMFNRPALRSRFFEMVEKGEFDGVRPTGTVMVRVEKKRGGGFAVVTHARSEREAVAYTNGYAKLCLQEYSLRRTGELRKWEEVLKKKKQDVFRMIQELNRNKETLISPLRVASPDKDYERLRVNLSERQEIRSKLNFSLLNLKARGNRLREGLKRINPKLLENKQTIKEKSVELKKLESEISVARELYTEENPKLIALLSRRKALADGFEKFLKDSGLSLRDTQMLEYAEKMHLDLQAVQAELESKEEELRVLESEIAVTLSNFETLTKVLPRYQEYQQQIASQRDSLQKVDESLADINYLLVLVKNDLFITEKATSAVGQKPFRKKNLAVAVFAALALAGLTTALVVLLELLFGNVYDEAEMPLQSELVYLGRIPVTGEAFQSENAGDLIFSALGHHLQSSTSDAHVVLAGALPGGLFPPEFFSAMEWAYAMSGKRVFFVDIVLAETLKDEQPMNDMGIIYCSGDKGVLPIADSRFILPAEQELLKQDLMTLRKNYDIIFFRHSFAFCHDRLFLEEFIPLCDSLLIAVGLKKTSRKNLRMLAALQRDTGLKIMTILTDGIASHFKKETSGK